MIRSQAPLLESKPDTYNGFVLAMRFNLTMCGIDETDVPTTTDYHDRRFQFNSIDIDIATNQIVCSFDPFHSTNNNDMIVHTAVRQATYNSRRGLNAVVLSRRSGHRRCLAEQSS
jgi:hypothetical protein